MLKIIKETAPTYTHRLEFDVLMKDLTTRKLELNFNGWDEWYEIGCNPADTALELHALIAKGLRKDRLVLGWKAARIDLQVGGKRREFSPCIKTNQQ